MDVACTIDGVDEPANVLGVPAMNFGQTHRWAGFRSVRFALRAPVDAFIANATPWFDRTRRELEDDLKHEIPEPEEPEHVLMRLGYPPLADFLGQAPDAACAFLRAWPIDVLDLLCPSPSTARYAANALTRVHLDGDAIAFKGEAFDRESRRTPS